MPATAPPNPPPPPPPNPVNPPGNPNATQQWTQPPSQASDAKEWLSTYLKLSALLTFGVITILFIAGLIVLVVLSRINDGFVPVNTVSRTVLNFDISVDLAWTTLPTFIISLYAFWFASTVNACADRQPYVELYSKPGEPGARLKQSLLLNYRSYFQGKNVCMAIKRRHPLLVFGFTLAIIVTFILTPLAAHLFAPRPTSSRTLIEITPSAEFHSDGITAQSNDLVDFDATSAALVAGGEPIPWTTENYSFQRFARPVYAVANVSASIQASSATLNCAIIDPSVLRFSGGQASFNFDDRGCILKGYVSAGLSIDSVAADYQQTFLNDSCGGGAAGNSRIAIVTFRLPSGSNTISDKVIVSCEPHYHNHTGILQVDYSVTVDGEPRVVYFDLKQTQPYSPARPVFATTFEKLLNGAEVFDLADPNTASDLGRITMAYAQQLQSSGSLTAETVRKAISQVFTTMYAFTAEQYAWQESSSASSVPGHLIFLRQRLFVYEPLAWTSIAVFVLVLVFLLCTFIYVRYHRSGLWEDPRTIMGSFTLLRENEFVEQLKVNGHGDVENGKVWEGVANPDGLTSGWSSWKCWEPRSANGVYWGPKTTLSTAPAAMKQGWYMHDVETAKTAQVKATNMVRAPTWKASFKSNTF